MTFEEALEVNKKIAYTNVGTSMMPLIREGRDVMVIEEITKPLHVNDAVLFVRPEICGRGRYVLHRIRKINADGTFFIIGDNMTKGENVSRENIIGILTQLKRGEKIIKTTDRGYVRFVKIWWIIFPIRFIIKKCRGFLGRCRRFVRKVLKG